MNHREYFEQLEFECRLEKEIRNEDARTRAELDFNQERSVIENDRK